MTFKAEKGSWIQTIWETLLQAVSSYVLHIKERIFGLSKERKDKFIL